MLAAVCCCGTLRNYQPCHTTLNPSTHKPELTRYKITKKNPNMQISYLVSAKKRIIICIFEKNRTISVKGSRIFRILSPVARVFSHNT